MHCPKRMHANVSFATNADAKRAYAMPKRAYAMPKRAFAVVQNHGCRRKIVSVISTMDIPLKEVPLKTVQLKEVPLKEIP